MTKKRILIVGDGNHQFITNYVRWIKNESTDKYCVDVFSYSSLQNQKSSLIYDNAYGINNENRLIKLVLGIKGVRRFFRFFLYKKIISKLTYYDFIHFHYISEDAYFLTRQFKNITKSKIIFSIWGSDMYRVKLNKTINFISACQMADYLTFTNEKSIDYFKTKYFWKKNNLKLCRFGLQPLENLKQLSKNRDECKKQLNWNRNKLAITIGYNLSPLQQHLEILDQFESEIFKEFKSYFQLILPITYGGNEKYKNQLLEKLNRLPFDYVVYDSFLTDEKVCQLRKASDVMIQLQVTDQFSGSMQEHLYARNVVVTGSWLPYETMKNEGVWFIEINNLNELPRIISEIAIKYGEYWGKTTGNPKIIEKLSSWKNTIHPWLDIYNN